MDQLLSTKLYIPSVRANAVERPRLVEKLLSGMESPGNFALLSGPAGFGKTTLLGEFVTYYGQPAAWISLDEGDNDFSHFWTYLIRACQSVLDDVGDAALELMGSSQSFSDETVPTILINDLVNYDKPLVLVLDDYHEIQNQTIHDSLLFLIDHLPDNLYIIISTRIDPPWPLGRYRVRNRLIEIRAQDLRFDNEEATGFLNRTMGLDLSVDDVAALEERTEGWIAGLQLAALSMHDRKDISAFVKAFTGSHVYVAEYLVEEVLQRQPEDIQTFLLQTSLLKQMNAELCEAVTGFQSSQTILQSLYRENIFLIPLDNEGKWFRYHHLFADLLNARLRQDLPAEEIAALHLRAADWFEQKRHISEAIDHALAANDFERVVELVKQTAHTLIFSGQINVLSGWLKTIPEVYFQSHPHLPLYLFWIDLLQRNADLSEQTIQEREALLEALPSSSENDYLRGELMSILCRTMVLSGQTSRTIRLALKTLELLPSDDLASRARTNSALAIAYDLEGSAEEADKAYTECFSQAITAGDYLLAAHTIMAKGFILYRSGQLQKATKAFQAVIDIKDQADFIPLEESGIPFSGKKAKKIFFPVGQGYIGLASVYLERNELKTAENYLNQGMELCRQGGLDGIFLGRILTSRLRLARGDLAGALEECQVSTRVFKDTINLATRKIKIDLARGDIDGAWHWAAPLVEMLNNNPIAFRPSFMFMEIPELSIARVYLAQGEMEKTGRLLDLLQSVSGADKRIEQLVEVPLLKALAYQKIQGGSPTPEIVENIKKALELAEPQGIVLLFLEEGPALIPLLKAVAVQRSTPERIKQYAHRLLDALETHDKTFAHRPITESVDLVEQLTPRESEVLELLAIGASNQDIADKLVITVRTVKKHTGNIYGKLNVNSRIQAVTRAYELGLLTTN